MLFLLSARHHTLKFTFTWTNIYFTPVIPDLPISPLKFYLILLSDNFTMCQHSHKAMGEVLVHSGSSREWTAFSGVVGDVILFQWLYLVCTSAAFLLDAPRLSTSQLGK